MPTYGPYSNTASALTLLPGRAPITPRLFLLQPTVVFAARVNLAGTASYPVTAIPFDTVTTGAYTDIKPGMTLLLGSTAGGDQYGRQRVRADATAISIFVGRSSRGTHDGELTLQSDAYVTVLDDYRVWAKIPYIAEPTDGVSEIFKDSNLEVEWRTTTPPPVANCGAGTASTIDAASSVITALFNGQRSFAVADGATIVSFLWDIADGTLTTGALTDDSITATFPAGFRWVSLTVTDSNGKTHTARCPVYARDPDDDTSFAGFDIEGAIRVTDQGQSITLRILEDMPRATYPDGTLAMIWDRDQTANADRDHMLIIGWLDTENASLNRSKTGLLRDMTITILDVAARLDQLPGFAQSLADDSTRDTEKIPAITWNYMIDPTLHKYIHYLLQWHSTALDVADFVISDSGDDYPFVLLASDGESLWNQVDRRARAFVPDRCLTCDRLGRLAIVPDPQLADVADRTSVVQAAITEDDYSDLRFGYQRAPRFHWLRGGAILAGSTTPIQTVFSIAPGDTPGQGLGEMTQGEQLALSQAAFNAAIGHRYARANARYGLLTLTLVQDDAEPGSAVPWRVLEPALKQWVTVDLDAEYAAQRGDSFSTVRGLPKELSIRYNRAKTGTTRTLELTVELETIGEPGTTVLKPVSPPVGDDPLVTVPPDFGLIEGQEMVVGVGIDGYLYRTLDFQTPDGSGGPTWDQVDTGIAGTIYSWVVDPFSPGYAPEATSGPINGWIVNDTDIYRVEDCFGTPSVESVYTFPVATSGAAFHWRSIQASFGAYFAAGVNPWLLVVSHYRDTAGHEGTWAVRSLDGGATWSTEVLVSGGYSTETPDRFQPIGVYTSPRTPGLAYTAAFIDIDDIPTADGYVSTDWGETWSRMSEGIDDSLGYLPRWGTVYDGGTLYVSGPSPTNTAGINAHEPPTAGSGPGGTTEQTLDWIIAPPANTVRMEVQFLWLGFRKEEGNSSGSAGSFAERDDNNHVDVISGDFVVDATLPPRVDGDHEVHFFGGVTIEWELISGTDWPVNRDTIISAPPVGGAGTSGSWIDMFVNANAVGTDNSVVFRADFYARVLELEFDDGTIYNPPLPGEGGIQPGHMQAGSIHVPWDDNEDESILYWGWNSSIYNRVFRLYRTTGTTIEEITPMVGPRQYGVNRYGFAIRGHDNNRLLLVASVIANDDNLGSDDDGHAVFKSTDGGETWSLLVSPVADTSAPDNRPAFEAAWGGDSEQVLFVWGPAGYVTYSGDQGATLDDRSGNLGALGASGWIGIAGGPNA